MNEIPGYGIDPRVYHQKEKRPLNNMLMINKESNIFYVKCCKELLNCLLQMEMFKKHIKIKIPIDQFNSLYERLHLDRHFAIHNISQWLDKKGNVLGSILAMNQILTTLNVMLSPVDDLVYTSLVEKADGYVLWLDGWVVLRHAFGCWYHMDPTSDLPRIMTETYLHCLIKQVILDKGLIFAASGKGMRSTCSRSIQLDFSPSTSATSTSPFHLVRGNQLNSNYLYLELVGTCGETNRGIVGERGSRFRQTDVDVAASSYLVLPEPEPPDPVSATRSSRFPQQRSIHGGGECSNFGTSMNEMGVERSSRSTVVRSRSRLADPWKQLASESSAGVPNNMTTSPEDNTEWPSLTESSTKRYRSKSRSRSQSVGRNVSTSSQQYVPPTYVTGVNQQYLPPRVAARNNHQNVTPRVTARDNQQSVTPRVAARDNQQSVTPRFAARDNQQYDFPPRNFPQFVSLVELPRPIATENNRPSVGFSNQNQLHASAKSARPTSPDDTPKQKVKEMLKHFGERLSRGVNHTKTAICCVCLETPSCVVLQPCRHLCLCAGCKPLYLESYKRCPICQQTVTSSTDVFLA